MPKPGLTAFPSAALLALSCLLLAAVPPAQAQTAAVVPVTEEPAAPQPPATQDLVKEEMAPPGTMAAQESVTEQTESGDIATDEESDGEGESGDRHVGYYYPAPQTKETYVARARTLDAADRTLRVGFITGITNKMMAAPYAPTAAMFAKGNEAQKMIIVALEDGRIDTLFRARAIFANLTAVARVMPIMEEMGVQDWFTFFDLAKLLGFTQITISDGRGFAHQVFLE